MITEAQIALREVITTTKDIIADPEKHMGRFTKDDRVSWNCFIVLGPGGGTQPKFG